jgi:hypothetical protein
VRTWNLIQEGEIFKCVFRPFKIENLNIKSDIILKYFWKWLYVVECKKDN